MGLKHSGLALGLLLATGAGCIAPDGPEDGPDPGQPFQVSAALRSESLRLPFPGGQTWYVCQGYRGVTHGSNYPFDLNKSSSCLNDYSGGSSVVAPGTGTVRWTGEGATKNDGNDFMCIDLDAGGSVVLGHTYPLPGIVSGSSVMKGQPVATVRQANTASCSVDPVACNGSNNGNEHIHLEYFAGKNCYQGGSPQPFAGDLQMDGAPNMVYPGTNYWAGTALTASEPSGSGRKRTDVAMFYQGAGSNIHVWRTLGSEFTHAGTPYSGAASYLNDVGDRMVAGDFNGDGKDDIATFAQGSSLNATDGKMRINVWLATGNSNFAAPGVWYTSSGSFTLSLLGGRVVAGDFNGDGKDDLAAFYKNGSSGAILYRWQSTGSGFSSPSAVWNVASGYNLDNVGSRMVAGDFNTDGKDDIANVYRVSGTEYRIHVWNSTGTSFYPSGSQASVAWIAVTNTIDVNTVAGRVAAGDFNSGGKADIAMMQTYGTDGARIIFCQSGGSSFLGCYYKWARDFNYDMANVGDRFAAGDFNKDGVFDVATAYQVEPGVMKLNVWPGGPSEVLTVPGYWWDSTMPPNYSYTLSNVGGRFVTGNWSGD